jgi:hypothetical protein
MKKDEPFSLLEHLTRQRNWSAKTFGPENRWKGVVDHIRKELVEIEATPNDLEEWIDVVLLALDGAWRSGATPEQIIAALDGKQRKNEARQWPDWRTVAADAAITHVKNAEPGPMPPPIVSEEEVQQFMAEFRADKHPLSPQDLAVLEKGREQLMSDIKKILADDAHLRIAHLSTCLRDVIALFDQADKSPDDKSPICTGDRREMWEQVLKRYGTP